MKMVYNGKEYEITSEQELSINKILGVVKFPLKVKDFDVFTIADIEFIKFPSENGKTPILAKNILFSSTFGETNNLSEATELLDMLKSEVLSKVENAIGKENVLEFETDLTALDGMKDYGKFKSKISLPTFDFIRNNVEVLDKYNPEKSYYIATPLSTPKRGYSRNVCYVNSFGVVNWDDCDWHLGVRPFLNLESSVSVLLAEN